MSNYKYYKLKKLKTLPDDVNLEFELEAKNKYKSQNLLAGLIAIRKGKKFATKEHCAMLINTRQFKILCYIEAHSGVVKDFKVNEFVVHKEKVGDLIGLWDDKDTEFVIPNSKRNSRIDWEMPK